MRTMQEINDIFYSISVELMQIKADRDALKQALREAIREAIRAIKIFHGKPEWENYLDSPEMKRWKELLDA